MAISETFISSREWTTETPTIDGTPEDVTAPAGGLYLWHSTASLSLLARVVAAMAAAGVASPEAYITELGYVRLASSGAFTITWNLATTLRDLLGFTGDLAGASAYTAPNRSTLLWRSGRRVVPMMAPRLAHGQPVLDISVHQGPRGVQTVRQEGEPTYVQRYGLRQITKARMFATPPTTAPGDFWHFWENELATNQQVILLYDATEGTSATTEVDWSGVTIVGPYHADMTQPEMHRGQFTREGGFERVENLYQAVVPVIVCEEFSA